MALTYRSPLEENFASYDSSVQAAIASTSATYYKDLEQENFKYFNYHIRPEGKKHLIEAGLYISPNAAVPHSHPVCKTLENHFLYIVLPPLLDNSFYFVGIKDSKISMLKTRNSNLTMINKLNRYVTSLDRVRYGPDFVVRHSKVVHGMQRHQPSLAGATLENLIPPLMAASVKNVFLHDELHYWSHKDLITLLEVLNPEIIYATFVYPPELLAGATCSLNKWCYTFDIAGKDLLFYPDGVKTEGYQQPLSSGYLLRTKRLILNGGSFYNVDIVQSKFSHHLICISKGKSVGPSIRAFGPFQATSCKGLEPLTRNVTNCFPIPFEIVSRVYRYLRTLKKPDAQSAMAKLSQLLPEPSGVEIKFLQDFADLVINTKTVNTMLQADHVTLFFTKWLQKLPKVLAAKFKSVRSLSLDDFISMLEPYSFHVALIDVDWSFNSYISMLDAEAEPEIDVVELMDGRFLSGQLPSFAPRQSATYEMRRNSPFPDYNQGLELGVNSLEELVVRTVIQEMCTPDLRAVSRVAVMDLLEAKCLASKAVIFPKQKFLVRIADTRWVSECLRLVISRYSRHIRVTINDNCLLWLLSTDRFYTPLLTTTPHGHGAYRRTEALWASVTQEVKGEKPKLVHRALPVDCLRAWGMETESFTSETPIGAPPVVGNSEDGSVEPSVGQTDALRCQCGLEMAVTPMPFPGEHGFKCPDRLRNRNVGWYAKDGRGYTYNGGSHECLGWPIWIEKWMELNGVDTSYYDCCLYQVYDEGASINFHSDNEAIFEEGAKIFTGNLSGQATFSVRCTKGCGSARLEPGSSFTMPNGFQDTHKHSVADATKGRASVTFRRLKFAVAQMTESESEGSDIAAENEFVTDLLLGKVEFSAMDTDIKYTSLEVPGDGSCFWHSLEVHTGMAATELKKVCRKVTYPDHEMQVELERQLGDRVFAEELAIMAAAVVLKASIVIYGLSEKIKAVFTPNGATTKIINLEQDSKHFRPIYPKNNCLIKALSLGLQRRECDLLRVIEEQLGDKFEELWRGEGVGLEHMEIYFIIFDVCALIDTSDGSRVLNEKGKFGLSFKFRDQHIEYIGKNPQVNIAINLGEQVGLSATEASLIYLGSVGSRLKYTATKERAAVLSKCLESGCTGVINSKLFNNVDNLIRPEHPSQRDVNVTGVFGTFGAGKSTVFRRFFEMNEGKNVVYVSPRKALAEEFKAKLIPEGKLGKLKAKHWRVFTFEILLKQLQLLKPGSVIILDEIQLYPPGYLDLVILLLSAGVHIVVGGDPCQSEYDSEKDRAWLCLLQKDLDRLLDKQEYKYNVLSRRFTNANFIGRLPCEFPQALGQGKLSEHFLLSSMEELRIVGGGFCRTFLVSSFEEKKVVETHFFDFQPKVLTFGESTGLNFSKGSILITNIAHLTSERRWVTALSRFSKNVALVNLTGTTWTNLLQSYKDRVLARFLAKTASLGDLHKLIPGNPEFLEGFEDKVGRNEGHKEEKVQGDPWLKGMLDLFQLEDVEEEEELLEECEEEWFKTHLPQAELEGVRARWVHRILAKELREVRMGYNVSEQFTDEYAKEEGHVLTNAAERFEAIYPRHRANDTVTFFMAVKKRLRFSRPATEKAKLVEAQMYGKFLLNEFLKKVPLRPKHEPSLMEKAKADFEEKKVSKSAATIENHAGRSCRDWLIDIGLIFSKSQLCTKFDNRFRVAKAAQSIVCFQHAVLCRFAPYMRYIEMKLQQALPKNFYIHSGKGLEELNEWVKKGRFDGICTESDYEAFDASQDQYMVAFEVEVMRFLGLPGDLIEDYKFIKTHLGSKLGNFAIMRFSGEASTFLFNTMANMLFTFLRYEIKGNEYICFAGDDMCASTRLTTKKTHEGFLNKLKLKAKVFMVDKPTFCGWHLSPDGIYKKPQLVMERMCIAKEKNNLANCIDNYAIEVSFAYRLGERAVNRMDEEEVESFYNCVRIIVKNKHLLKSDIAKLFSRALVD